MVPCSRIAVFIMLTNLCFGQSKLSGTYCSPTDFVGYCLTLKSNSTFEYSGCTCTGGATSSGIYKSENNDLEILFTSDDSSLANSYTLQEYACKSLDSITLIFSAFDKQVSGPYEPIPFVAFYVINLNRDTV